MQGRCYVKIVNEIDRVTPAALNALRQYLDDLPPYIVFIGTTNKGVKDLPDPLQSRFQVWKFDPVPTAEIAALLRQTHDLDEPTATSIAQHSSGCVRAALCDAQSELDARALRQLAA